MADNMMKAVKIHDDFGIFYNHQLDNIDLKPTDQRVSIAGIIYQVYEPNTTALNHLLPLSHKIGTYHLEDYLMRE